MTLISTISKVSADLLNLHDSVSEFPAFYLSVDTLGKIDSTISMKSYAKPFDIFSSLISSVNRFRNSKTS